MSHGRSPTPAPICRAVLAGAALAFMLVGCGPPGEARKFHQIGLDYYNREQYYEAIAQFENARKIDRETPETAYYIGRCWLRIAERKLREDVGVSGMRFCDRAAYEFERAYNAFPGYSKALQGRAEALKLRGRFTTALEIAAWASANAAPRAKMLIFESRELAQAGDLDRCLRKLKEAVAVEPDNAAAHAELGRFYLRCGNDSEAVRCLRTAYRLDPGAPGVVSALSSLDALPPTNLAATPGAPRPSHAAERDAPRPPPPEPAPSTDDEPARDPAAAAAVTP